MDKQGKILRRVVLVPLPFQGHINPMLQLGTILYSKGFSITVIHTKFNSPNPSNHPEFNFQHILNEGIDDILASGDLLDLILELNHRSKIPLHQCLLQIMQQNSDNEIACVVYDDLMYFAEAVSNHLNLPTIVVRTSSAATFLARASILQLNSRGYIPFPDSISKEPVPELPSIRFKDLPIFKSETPERFYRFLANACDIKTSAAVIWNTMDFLEESALAKQKKMQFQIPIFTIGPMHKFAPAASSSSLLKEDASCISWLDRQICDSVLYISMGSVVSIYEKELAEMAWVLAETKQPFLWVIRPGSIIGSEWIELLPDGFIGNVGERGCIVKWAPQKQVLAHPAVGGFWSHCGWNSTLESIAEGVPMICRPSFGDQSVTARYICNVWGIGLELEGKLEKKDVERVVRRLMVDEEGLEIRQRAKDLKEKVEVSFKKGGSSFDSLNKLVEFISSL